jgi:hypothetical protein
LRKTKKYEHGGRLKFKINILFYGDNSRTAALTQTKCCTTKNSGHTYKFYLNNYFLQRPSENGEGGIFKLLRWMKNLHHSTWDHRMLYAGRSLEVEQLLIRPLMQKTKNTNMVGGWYLKLIFFMVIAHEPLRLEQRSFVQ